MANIPHFRTFVNAFGTSPCNLLWPIQRIRPLPVSRSLVADCYWRLCGRGARVLPKAAVGTEFGPLSIKRFTAGFLQKILVGRPLRLGPCATMPPLRKNITTSFLYYG